MVSSTADWAMAIACRFCTFSVFHSTSGSQVAFYLASKRRDDSHKESELDQESGMHTIVGIIHVHDSQFHDC